MMVKQVSDAPPDFTAGPERLVAGFFVTRLVAIFPPDI
jgi:hypothetical protein